MTDEPMDTARTTAEQGWRRPVGVIGGVGPMATVYFLDRVVRLTDAARDQDHLDMVVLQHSTVPDRTAFVLGRADADPGPVMAADARRLELLGACFVVLPCNTASRFRQQMTTAVGVPVLDIVEETVRAAAARRPALARVGLMATEGTVAAGVYQDACAAAGLECLLPSDDDQDIVTRVIYDQVKAGLPAVREDVTGVVDRLAGAGAELVLLGCTELSVAAVDLVLLADPRIVDSLDALARSTITRAGHRVRTR